MRRSGIVIIMILSWFTLALPVKAQFSLGVNSGIMRTKFSGDAVRGVGHILPEPGFSAGARMDYRFSDAIALSFQPGINTLRSTYRILNDSGTATIDSLRMNMTSFSLPVHTVVWSENGRYFVSAGIQFDYVLRFRSESLLNDPSPIITPSFDEVRDYQLYIQFGAGFIIPLGKPYLSFELRYSQGILDLSNPWVQYETYLARTKLTNLSLVVGLQVPLGTYAVKYPVKRNNR